jgi:hypothetical protein
MNLGQLTGRCVFAAMLLALAGLDARAEQPDPMPPQVSVDFFYPPSVIIQHTTPRLVYEMRISNYVPRSYVLDSIEVQAGAKTFTYAGDTLRNMMRFFGDQRPVPPTTHL